MKIPMSLRRAVVFLFASLALFLFGRTFAQTYVVTDLGIPGGFTTGVGANSVAHGINNSGAVTGEWGGGLNWGDANASNYLYRFYRAQILP